MFIINNSLSSCMCIFLSWKDFIFGLYFYETNSGITNSTQHEIKSSNVIFGSLLHGKNQINEIKNYATKLKSKLRHSFTNQLEHMANQ
jgi:hypothetical protein